MSIHYKDNLVSPLPNAIDDKNEAEDKIYSSAYIQAYIDYLNKELADLALEIKPSVKGVVGTKAELDNYATDTLQEKDVIYVLADETHDGYTSYYRWNGTAFDYIGSLDPYYTPEQIDNLLDARQDTLVSGTNIKTINGVDVLGAGDIIISYKLDEVYPVGSVYMSKDKAFDPNVEFGGNWEKEQPNYFLYSTTGDVEYGGEATVELTTDTIPAHTHYENPHTHSGYSNCVKYSAVSTIPSGTTYKAIPMFRDINSTNKDGAYDDFELGKANWNIERKSDTDWLVLRNTDGTINTIRTAMLGEYTGYESAGERKPHDNIPPYMEINIWHRIA